MTVKPHLIVTAAVIGHDGLVMIARRPSGARHAGHWEFPGGKLEAGESLTACLVREITEELGLAVEVGEQLIAVEHDYGEFSLTLHAFRCRLLPGQDIPEASGNLVWVRPEELANFELLPPDRRIASVLMENDGLCNRPEGL